MAAALVDVTLVHHSNLYEVHRDGCADVRRGDNRRREHSCTAATSRWALVVNWFSDIAEENELNAEESYSAYAECFRFEPCVADLPERSS